MDTYKDELAPWERRSDHYQKVELGQSLESVKGTLKDQTFEMIQSRIAKANEIIANPKMDASSILELGYDLKSVGEGIYGLKAAFEWGISDVVWQIELNGKYLSESLGDLYKTFKPQVKKLFNDAKAAYGEGSVEEALEKFLELDAEISFDFATHITLGIIYLFHEINKERAGEYFNKALNYVRSTSHYYTAYVLIYNALIKRDFGKIEEAESCTREAMNICSNFTEAMYQNAQYNALLNKPDIVIPLLRKVIKSDIIYCLKIHGEQDFEGIRADIGKLFEEIREEQNRDASNGFKELKKKVISLNESVVKVKDLGYDLPKTFFVESLRDDNNEVELMISRNTIFDAYTAKLFLLPIGKSTQKKKLALKEKCKNLIDELEDKRDSLGRQLFEENKKKPFSRFIMYFVFGQFVAVPVGISFGIPVGIYVAEFVLFALCLIFNLGRSGNSGKEILALEEKKERLYWVMKTIKT
ncbi:MAG: hypothetical protein D8M57_14100 [Candidatus Scalindua sp. AMX11]|nr:MAG: hypothetical protein DWQ00_09375 [Candidatus Scalindua sp.]NOG83578.1 hypothetical protein [Planctomycetota bacterium]RZV70920.1 MAG: hypothetical protein EX341_15055 [Candidatus Scalindua sp. SCAELEC01]TDE64226.1 MAG: hypothetical protein D8M57_14100 [Candidatus Scalindua sp. AMX11]GJQ59981.1 MAG: hypothetical protein SCALA701_27820 [Candidatus Scalindua sp.]